MKYMYTATFTIEDSYVYARVPDLPGCITSGHSLEETIDLITDAASVWLVSAEDYGVVIPMASAQSDLDIPQGTVVSLIRVDTIAYRAATDTRAVRKNVSLPAWMATLADKRGINCSQVLQDGLLAKLSQPSPLYFAGVLSRCEDARYYYPLHNLTPILGCCTMNLRKRKKSIRYSTVNRPLILAVSGGLIRQSETEKPGSIATSGLNLMF